MHTQQKRAIFFCLFCGLMSIWSREVCAFDKKLSSALSYYILAGVYSKAGDITAATQEYKKAVQLDPTNHVIHLGLAVNYLKNNAADKAIEELNAAAQCDPEAVEPPAILSLLYSSQNKMELAAVQYEASLKNASKLHPGNIGIYKSLGILYLQQRKFQDAADIYQLIVDLTPKDAEAYFYLANALYELNRKQEIEKYLQKAIDLNPTYDEALNYLGYFYIEENRKLDEAETLVRKALQFQPENGAYVDSLGWLYFKKGRLGESLQELNKARSLMEDPEIYDHLGEVYFKMGDVGKAKENWEKALRLDPSQRHIREKLSPLGMNNGKK